MSPDKGTPSAWGDWECVESCGETIEFRNRTCLAPLAIDIPAGCTFDCDEKLYEVNECFAGCCVCKCDLLLNPCILLTFILVEYFVLVTLC